MFISANTIVIYCIIYLPFEMFFFQKTFMIVDWLLHCSTEWPENRTLLGRVPLNNLEEIRNPPTTLNYKIGKKPKQLRRRQSTLVIKCKKIRSTPVFVRVTQQRYSGDKCQSNALFSADLCSENAKQLTKQYPALSRQNTFTKNQITRQYYREHNIIYTASPRGDRETTEWE